MRRLIRRHYPYFKALAILAAVIVATPAPAAVSVRVESRPISSPIEAYITVTDANGQPVGGLTSVAFTVKLDGNRIDIQPPSLSLPPAQNPDQNVSVVFVMDYSPSVAGTPTEVMQEAVVDFINSMSPGDYAAIVKFNGSNPSKASVVQPFTAIDGAAGNSALVSAAMAPYPGDATNLYDGIDVALDEFIASAGLLPAGPKAVLAISDGQDNASVKSLNSVVDKASANGIPLFTVAVGTAGTNGQQVLNSLAARTGGVYVSAPNDTAVKSAYATIEASLKNSYLLTFTSTISDCSQHTLEVQVTGQSAPASVKFTRCDAAKPATNGNSGGGGGGALGVPDLLVGAAALAAMRRRRGMKPAVPISLSGGNRPD